MKSYNAIGFTYNCFGRLKKKEILETFPTMEEAREFLSLVADKYDDIDIEEVTL